MRPIAKIIAFAAALLLTTSVSASIGVASSTELTASPYYKVRVAAARALTGRADPLSRQALLALAADAHPLVRVTAVHALGFDPSPEADAAVRRARRDQTPLVRAYARK